MAQTSRPCTSCGTTIHRTPGQRGPIKTQCEQCKPPSTRGTCPTCGRPTPRTVRNNGSVYVHLYCSEDCKPRCAVPDCGQSVRKRGMCARCYAIAHKGGDPTNPHHRWAPAPRIPKGPPTRSRLSPALECRCYVCGRTPDDGPWESHTRRWCSRRCERLWYKHAGNVPASIQCASCGVEVPLARPGQKRKRSDTKLCRDCSRDPQYLISVLALEERDGPECGLCRDYVDVTIMAPDPMSPSIDHVLPRSRGGTNAPENCQLAHRGCNSAKKDRVGYQLMALFPNARMARPM